MAELTYPQLVKAFGQLELRDVPVLAHASLHAFGRINGGGESFVQALLESVSALVMPTHTYATYASLASRDAASDALLEEAEIATESTEPVTESSAAKKTNR